MALNTNINFVIKAFLTSGSDFDPSAPHVLPFGATLQSGTGAGQADLVWGDKGRQLAASANEDLDLAGVLTGALGGTITFARIKALVVIANAGNTNNVVVGGAATNTWVGPFGAATHTESVAPGGLMVKVNPTAAGWPVTAGTGDLLRIANSGAGSAVNFDVLLIGASA